MAKGSVQAKNKEFYQRLYSKSGIISHILHMSISFDQQSKAKVNKKVLSPYIDNALSIENEAGVSLLDFGSGWGSMLRKIPKELNLYCFDLSQKSMQLTCATLGKLGYNIHKARVTENKIVPENLDFIVCSHVLEHVDSDIDTLRLFSVALKESGVLLINVPINEVWEDPKHIRFYDEKSVRQALRTAGFELISIDEVDRWTGFLLSTECSTEYVSVLKKLIFKSLRVFLAIIPLSVCTYLETLFLKKRPFQQMIIVARRVKEPLINI